MKPQFTSFVSSTHDFEIVPKYASVLAVWGNRCSSIVILPFVLRLNLVYMTCVLCFLCCVLQKGRVLERENDHPGAKSHFEAALSINPYHVKGMTYLVCWSKSCDHSAFFLK